MRLFDGIRGMFDDSRDYVDTARRRGMGRAEDVRDRITGDDRPNPLLIAGLGAAAGALAAFLLDPDRGRARRARYGDQAAALVRRGVDRVGRGVRFVTSTVEGKVEALQHAGGDEDGANLDDAALADKVETELFRDQTIPKGKINVNVERGRVVLRGEIDSVAQSRKLEKQASRIPGVWAVENLLHLPGEPAPTEAIASAR